MKLISSTKKEKCRYDLKMEISGEVFMNEVNAVYKKQVKSISIPGFRKGKAPRSTFSMRMHSKIFIL